MTKPKRIQRKRTKGWRMPPNTVSVTRPGKHSNRYRVERLSGPRSERGEEWIVIDTRTDAWAFRYIFPNKIVATEHAISAFESEIDEQMRNEIRRDLRGQHLACWCPLTDNDGNQFPCHADVLLEIANR